MMLNHLSSLIVTTLALIIINHNFILLLLLVFALRCYQKYRTLNFLLFLKYFLMA